MYIFIHKYAQLYIIKWFLLLLTKQLSNNLLSKQIIQAKVYTRGTHSIPLHYFSYVFLQYLFSCPLRYIGPSFSPSIYPYPQKSYHRLLLHILELYGYWCVPSSLQYSPLEHLLRQGVFRMCASIDGRTSYV